MEKARSKGVTFWGWVFIIFGIIGISEIRNAQQSVALYGAGLAFFNIILSVANIITGIFLLKLNETARKAAIMLGVIGIMLIPFWVKALYKSNQQCSLKSRQYIMEQAKPESQQEGLVAVDRFDETSKKALPIIAIFLFGLPMLIFELLPIIFFTRPKVKEQFR